MADALYESKLEPWCEYLTGNDGQVARVTTRSPSPLSEAHARGTGTACLVQSVPRPHAVGEVAPPPKTTSPRSRPDLAKPYGKHYWMNPTHPDVQEHSLAVILDVVKRYDIDGVHIDDYFYPYKEKDAGGKIIPFPDDDTWAEVPEARAASSAATTGGATR